MLNLERERQGRHLIANRPKEGHIEELVEKGGV